MAVIFFNCPYLFSYYALRAAKLLCACFLVWLGIPNFLTISDVSCVYAIQTFFPETQPSSKLHTFQVLEGLKYIHCGK